MPRLTRFACGATHHDVGMLVTDGPRGRRTFPSAVYLFDDGARRVLFDTGYAAPPWDTGLAGVAYRALLPPVIGPEQTLGARLRAAGVDPASITDVVLSHAHPDHIGGLADLHPDVRVLISAGVRATLDAPRLREGILRGLLPDWFDAAAQVVPDEAFAALPGLGLRAHDPWGDGAFRLLALPGHARGHLGALVDGAVVLAGDAAWSAELLPAADRLRPLPRFIQHDAAAYAATAATLAASGLRLCFSHDDTDESVLLG